MTDSRIGTERERIFVQIRTLVLPFVGKNEPNNIRQWTAAGYLKGDQKDTKIGPFYTFDQLSNVLTCGLISGCALFARFADDRSGGANLADPDTGTGWTNYILTAMDMAFTKDHIYAFRAQYHQNGGSDSFFVIDSGRTPGGPPGGGVPLPGTLALLGAGLFGLVRTRRVGRVSAD